MIIFEVIGEIFVEVIFNEILIKVWKFIGKVFNKIGDLFSGTKKVIDPIKVLEKKYLYKKIELTDNLNEVLKSGVKGSILEIIDRNKLFAKFYDGNGNQIEWNNKLVFEIKMNQFKLKK
ncbi:hypothetical protein LY01_01409 [Nonlabens xylanidelens]|uniref:Uncharacterized protein n=1 Tax=Nonlabens xylanidelens TaxID=191564 RepID=A0A2S6IP03_9FLAO|nr:hypothetical protein [Nonlabens xylanidelens]PPK95816.1 hypothetical protein LY01_01409 [Nonlabens xylanidelens]PQJ22600.1 hypothetical protein BST94_03250 [Nonlabens xylanidelens]